MALSEIKFEKMYKTLISDVSKDFFVPALSQASMYKRVVGFFSSSAFAEIATGIKKIAGKGVPGSIRLIASPKLSDDDVVAIDEGYKQREEVIKAALLKSMDEIVDEKVQRKLGFLSHLIADGILDIKIAFKKNKIIAGMLHEKEGVIIDSEGMKLAFSGSNNETYTGLVGNRESIHVFCAWDNPSDADRVELIEHSFDMLWDNVDPTMETFDFPVIAKEKLATYKKENIKQLIESGFFEDDDKTPIIYKRSGFAVPPKVSLHPYQNKAIEKWQENHYRGLFDMATGTGKTYTALGALSYLCDKLKDILFVVIVCPYQHLVEQWTEDIEAFNIKPMKAYSNYQWKNRLDNLVINYNLNRDKTYCVVTTNATFASMDFQASVSRLKGDACLVVDEVHNIGANSLKKCLLPIFKYRLGLSATINRFHDKEGTQAIKDYFGDICFNFSLDDAIGVFLTDYKYYIVPVYLTADEWEQYSSLTYAIGKNLTVGKDGKRKLTAYGEKLAIKRARVIAGAYNKIAALEEQLGPYAQDDHILIYCGATKMPDFDENDKSETDNELIKQTTKVMQRVGNDLHMSVSQFTAEEDVETRKILKERFVNGDRQALVAIKCLDEGVNIPSIKTAFILSSTTNPKEYIQRRGRVLRKSDGKKYAEIFDFVTLPREPKLAKTLTAEDMKKEKKLVIRELRRIEEFVRLALNKNTCYGFIDEIKEAYNITSEDYKQITDEEDY